MTEWHDIATAPVWTDLLTWNGKAVQMAYRYEMTAWSQTGSGLRLVPQPTHWTPVPAPPEAA